MSEGNLYTLPSLCDIGLFSEFLTTSRWRVPSSLRRRSEPLSAS